MAHWPFPHQDSAKAIGFNNNNHLSAHSLPWKVLPKGIYFEPEDTDGSGTPYAYAADLSAEIPVSSESMSVLAEGAGFGSGVINIFEDSEDKHAGDVHVDVRMFYNAPQILKLTNISYVQAPGNENGVRIHVSGQRVL